MDQLFHDGDLFHTEPSPLICRTNQWTGFSMIETFVMKKLKDNFGTHCSNKYLWKNEKYVLQYIVFKTILNKF